MIRIAIIENGRITPPEALATPDQLRSAMELARSLIVECEGRLKSMTPPAQATKPAQRPVAPYLS
jgi:hypothetical protein